jgi:hypothetical protein
LPYDRLILSPGIDFVDGAVEGWGVSAQNGECPELCVSELAHAGFRYGHALKRSSNMIAN